MNHPVFIEVTAHVPDTSKPFKGEYLTSPMIINLSLAERITPAPPEKAEGGFYLIFPGKYQEWVHYTGYSYEEVKQLLNIPIKAGS